MNALYPKIVAVDGPAGSGKSSICSKVCKQLGWTYINTGAIYRAIGALAERFSIDLDNEEELANWIPQALAKISWNDELESVFYENENLQPLIACEAAGRNASKIGQWPKIRNFLLPFQRNLAINAPKGALLDGRDIGTVVFPDAGLKIFLTASIEERARRRLRQLEEKPSTLAISLEELKEKIAQRDGQDQNRSTAPMIRAQDAIEVDTSFMTIEEAIESLKNLIQKTFF